MEIEKEWKSPHLTKSECYIYDINTTKTGHDVVLDWDREFGLNKKIFAIFV